MEMLPNDEQIIEYHSPLRKGEPKLPWPQEVIHERMNLCRSLSEMRYESYFRFLRFEAHGNRNARRTPR